MEELKENMYESDALLLNNSLNKLVQKFNSQPSFIQKQDKSNLPDKINFKQKHKHTSQSQTKSSKLEKDIIKTSTLVTTVPVLETYRTNAHTIN